MRRTAVVNPKGGTGKTTSTVNLAALAARAGIATRVIDLDEQGSTTQWFGADPRNDDLAPALLKGSLDELVVPTSIPGLDLVPGSIELADDTRITKEPGHQMLLREALDHMKGPEWVFIDCPGDLGPLTIMGLTAASDVLIPVAAGSLELDEIPKLKVTLEKVRARLNPELTIAGVLVTRVDRYGRNTSAIARDVIKRLRVEFPNGELLNVYVQENVRHREAPAYRQPTVVLDPGGRGETDYAQVLTELRRRETTHA
jgi:chromosome partitioning protein